MRSGVRFAVSPTFLFCFCLLPAVVVSFQLGVSVGAEFPLCSRTPMTVSLPGFTSYHAAQIFLPADDFADNHSSGSVLSRSKLKISHSTRINLAPTAHGKLSAMDRHHKRVTCDPRNSGYSTHMWNACTYVFENTFILKHCLINREKKTYRTPYTSALPSPPPLIDACHALHRVPNYRRPPVVANGFWLCTTA